MRVVARTVTRGRPGGDKGDETDGGQLLRMNPPFEALHAALPAFEIFAFATRSGRGEPLRLQRQESLPIRVTEAIHQKRAALPSPDTEVDPRAVAIPLVFQILAEEEIRPDAGRGFQEDDQALGEAVFGQVLLAGAADPVGYTMLVAGEPAGGPSSDGSPRATTSSPTPRSPTTAGGATPTRRLSTCRAIPTT